MRELAAGTAEVWWANPQVAPEQAVTVLAGRERARYDAYRAPAEQRRFLAAAALLRIVLGQHLGVPPAAVPIERTCGTCGRPHGRPRLADGVADLEVSVSHSGDQVAVAVTRGARIGVDVEKLTRDVDVAGIGRLVLSDLEADRLRALPPHRQPAAFVSLWTRKEAVLKALGTGLATPMRELELTGPDDPPRILSWPPDVVRPPTAHLRALTPADGHLAHLAVFGPLDDIRELDGSFAFDPLR